MTRPVVTRSAALRRRLSRPLGALTAALFGLACGLEVSGQSGEAPVAQVSDGGPDADIALSDAGTLIAHQDAQDDACTEGVDCASGCVGCDAADAPPPPPPPECTKATDCVSAYCVAGTCDFALSCNALHTAAASLPSGPYLVRPKVGMAPFRVYCDMTRDGGGWLLAAKVHRHHAGFAANDEVHDWWSTASDVGALVDDASYENRPPGVAAHGRTALAGVAETARLARFTLVAENAPATRVSWFKEVKPDLWTWFTVTSTQTASKVCSDVGMTASCSQGTIAYRAGACLDATCLEGMSLAAHGRMIDATRFIHMRLKGDNDETQSGLCSYTFDDATWPDSDNTHWGNGLIVWLR